MTRNIIYQLYGMKWTINFDRYIAPIKSKPSVFTTMWCDHKTMVAHNTPMSERIISDYYNIPIERLKSEIYDFEDQLLQYVNNALARHQWGRFTKEELDEHLEILLSGYVKMYMHELYHLSKEYDIINTRRRFEERQKSIAENNTSQ